MGGPWTKELLKPEGGSEEDLRPCGGLESIEPVGGSEVNEPDGGSENEEEVAKLLPGRQVGFAKRATVLFVGNMVVPFLAGLTSCCAADELVVLKASGISES